MSSLVALPLWCRRNFWARCLWTLVTVVPTLLHPFSCCSTPYPLLPHHLPTVPHHLLAAAPSAAVCCLTTCPLLLHPLPVVSPLVSCCCPTPSLLLPHTLPPVAPSPALGCPTPPSAARCCPYPARCCPTPYCCPITCLLLSHTRTMGWNTGRLCSLLSLVIS
ncbi:hypothetical protein V8C86DRAFT_882124 [Haematococcus lacustris]